MADRSVPRPAEGGTEQSHWATLTGSVNLPPDHLLKKKPLPLPSLPSSSMWDGIRSECTDRDEPEVEWKAAERTGLTHRMLSLQVDWNNKSRVNGEGDRRSRI